MESTDRRPRKTLRKNVRMVKLNYILPDFLKTANNEAEGFWIPGDFQAAGIVVQTDLRNPWVSSGRARQTERPVRRWGINQNGQQLQRRTSCPTRMIRQ